MPHLGRTATPDAVAQHASASSISAGQRQNEQVADATVDLYRSEGSRRLVFAYQTRTMMYASSALQRTTATGAHNLWLRPAWTASVASSGRSGCRILVCLRREDPVMTFASPPITDRLAVDHLRGRRSATPPKDAGCGGRAYRRPRNFVVTQANTAIPVSPSPARRHELVPSAPPSHAVDQRAGGGNYLGVDP